MPWCDDAGHHRYYEEEAPGFGGFNSHTRTCWHKIPNNIARVAAEVFETEDGVVQAPIVTINHGDIDLESPEQVDEFVAALQRAATIAFSADEKFRARRDAVLEFDAAVAECVARAGTPGNRADSALIRLRNAQDALDATPMTSVDVEPPKVGLPQRRLLG